MNTEVSQKIATLPNLITLIRLLLVPVFAVLLLLYENNIAAFILFLIAAATDFLDGAVARATGQVSELGQKLDPLVDRFLILTAVIVVFILGRVPFWILLLLVARDLSMMVLVAQLRATQQPEFKVAFVGKAATALNMTGFCMIILMWPVIPGTGGLESGALAGWGSGGTPLGIWFIYVGTALAWVAGIYYMLRAYRASQHAVQGAQDTAQGQAKSVPFAGTGLGATPARTLNKPQKLFVGTGALALLVVALALYCVDVIGNLNVVHSGVRVGTVDTGGMSEEAAAGLLHTELNTLASSAPVILYADEQARAAGVTEQTQEMGHGVGAYNQSGIDTEATSWSISLATLDAEINGAGIARQAYAVGRNGDFLLGRLAANTVGVTVQPTIDYSAGRLRNIEELLTASIGVPLQNADIIFANGRFSAKDGLDGRVVDEERLEALLNEAFLTNNREIVVPMVDRKMYVTLQDAEKVAESVNVAIAKPVKVSYAGTTWELSTSVLGQVITTKVELDESGTGTLVPTVDPSLLQGGVTEIIGAVDEHVDPINARFVAVEGTLQITPSQEGTGVDYPRLAADLNSLLFGTEAPDATQIDTEARRIPLQIGVLKPGFTTNDAETYSFATKISEYTIEYPWVSEGTITNIHVAANIINSSIISPYGTWSFNETAGECTAEQGFVEANIILGDEYVDEIGGGVCNVATSVFNAAFEAGYPINSRVNHSLRVPRYPAGRDAAIAYPYADLQFTNDTDNYLLLTMSYTDSTVTCTLWGVPPGYVVESVSGELVEGADFQTKETVDEDMWVGYRNVEQTGLKASSIEVTRTVYYADGSLKETRTFYSSYDSTPEIVTLGPEEDEEETEDTTG